MVSLTLKNHRFTLFKHAAEPETLLKPNQIMSAGIPAAKPVDVETPREPQTTPPRARKGKRTVLATLAVALVLGAGLGIYQWINFASAHEATDDAYTTAHLYQVSPRINGDVIKVLVDDNQHVRAGQVLVQLDPQDYQVRVEQAQAALEIASKQAKSALTTVDFSAANATSKDTQAAGSLEEAQAAISRAKAAAREAKSSVPEAEATLAQRQAEERRASLDYSRYSTLAQQGAVSYQQRDQALRDFQVATNASKAAQEMLNQARARVDQAEQSIHQAQASMLRTEGLVQEAKALSVQTKVNSNQYEVQQAAIHQAQAQLKDALLQLSYTHIVSPADGRIGKKNVEKGQRVQPGSQLFQLVGDDIWVVANFKETQLEKMRPNQPVEITIDTFPHHKFSGHVDSLSPGSGASFALLPPENATGNFTKIVQRVPVKVLFDKESIKGYEGLLGPGMSAVVDVNVGK